MPDSFFSDGGPLNPTSFLKDSLHAKCNSLFSSLFINPLIKNLSYGCQSPGNISIFRPAPAIYVKNPYLPVVKDFDANGHSIAPFCPGPGSCSLLRDPWDRAKARDFLLKTAKAQDRRLRSNRNTLLLRTIYATSHR